MQLEPSGHLGWMLTPALKGIQCRRQPVDHKLYPNPHTNTDSSYSGVDEREGKCLSCVTSCQAIRVGPISGRNAVRFAYDVFIDILGVVFYERTSQAAIVVYLFNLILSLKKIGALGVNQLSTAFKQTYRDLINALHPIVVHFNCNHVAKQDVAPRRRRPPSQVGSW